MEAAVDTDGDKHHRLFHPDNGDHRGDVYLRAALYAEVIAWLGTPLVCQCHHGCADNTLHRPIPQGHHDEEEPQ